MPNKLKCVNCYRNELTEPGFYCSECKVKLQQSYRMKEHDIEKKSEWHKSENTLSVISSFFMSINRGDIKKVIMCGAILSSISACALAVILIYKVAVLMDLTIVALHKYIGG